MMMLAEECGLAVVETAALREEKRQSDAFEESLRAVQEQTQREEARQRAQMRREARAARRKLRFWRLAAVLALMALTAVLLTASVWPWIGREPATGEPPAAGRTVLVLPQDGDLHEWERGIGGEADGIE